MTIPFTNYTFFYEPFAIKMIIARRETVTASRQRLVFRLSLWRLLHDNLSPLLRFKVSLFILCRTLFLFSILFSLFLYFFYPTSVCRVRIRNIGTCRYGIPRVSSSLRRHIVWRRKILKGRPRASARHERTIANTRGAFERAGNILCERR